MSQKFIIFNSTKAAEHYVKWCNRNLDYYNSGYDWSESKTYIKDNMLLRKASGDSCGCGCNNYYYNHISVIGRIRDRRTHSLNTLLK